MKAVIALLTAAVSYTAAKPHANDMHHQHLHLHGRQAPSPTDAAVVPGPTHVVYVLNGQTISPDDVHEGIKNGTLVWANGKPGSEPVPASSPSLEQSSSPDQSPPSYSSPPPASYPSSPGGYSGSSQGVDSEFPDGQLDCSTFPSDYGAVNVDWLNLGGWTGIQSPGSTDGGYGDIQTATQGPCTEGSFCSYACPAGYQKSQWPSTQGTTGQSVGGIQCQGGKLHLTNSGMSKNLCIKGAPEVTVQVQNKLGSVVAVCRTDYPGTESETIPLSAAPGSTNPLTCPEGDHYYNWEGSHTSAQYYVNPSGVSVEDGCQWGSSSNPWGNWAPLNLGVGYTNGAAWLSIFQNSPTTSASLDFSVEIQGDGMSGTCRYSNGQYCGGSNYDDCSSTTGCTVSYDVCHFIRDEARLTSYIGIYQLRHSNVCLLKLVVQQRMTMLANPIPPPKHPRLERLSFWRAKRWLLSIMTNDLVYSSRCILPTRHSASEESPSNSARLDPARPTLIL